MALTKRQRIRQCLILFCAFIPAFVSGQSNDVDFIIRAIKQNYPGFAAKIGRLDFEQWAHKVADENKEDTFLAIGKIAFRFNDPHLQVLDLRDHPPIDSAACSSKLSIVRAYLDGRQHKKKYEGYWFSDHNDCIIGLICTNERKFKYEAYVIESRDTFLAPGQLTAKMECVKGNRFLPTTIARFLAEGSC